MSIVGRSVGAGLISLATALGAIVPGSPARRVVPESPAAASGVQGSPGAAGARRVPAHHDTRARTGEILRRWGSTSVTSVASPRASATEFTLSVRVLDRSGRPLTWANDPNLVGGVYASSCGPGPGTQFPLKPDNGRWVATLPRGVYSLQQVVATRRPGAPTLYSLATHAPFSLTADRAYTLDARRTVPVTATVDAPDAKLSSVTIGTRCGGGGADLVVPNAGNARFYAQPTGTALATWGYRFTFAPVLTSARGTYELLLGGRDRVPSDLAYRISDGSLAHRTIEVGARGVGTSGRLEETAQTDDPVGQAYVWNALPTDVPNTVPTLVSAVGPGGVRVAWSTLLRADAGYWEEASNRRYAAGSESTLRLGYPGYGPSAHWTADPDLALFGTVPLRSDAATDAYDEDQAGRLELRRGSTVLATSSDPADLQGPIDWGTAPLTLALSATNADAAGQLPASVRATWTFRPPDFDAGTSPALLQARLTGGFDGYGRAPANHDFTLVVAVEADDPSMVGRVARPTLQLSYDDGRTLSPVPVVAHGPTWTATPRLPKVGAGGQAYASYRVTVHDDRGNAYDATTIRGFVVRG